MRMGAGQPAAIGRCQYLARSREPGTGCLEPLRPSGHVPETVHPRSHAGRESYAPGKGDLMKARTVRWTAGLVVWLVHFWYSFGAWFDMPAHGFYTKAAEAPRYDALWPGLSLPVACLLPMSTGPLVSTVIIGLNSAIVASVGVAGARLVWRRVIRKSASES